MNLISAILLAAAIAAPAGAADFSDLQGLKASAISKVNPFPNPSGPDSCYLQGLKDGQCNFKCRSGETFQIKPVNPGAASVYEQCGGGDYRGADKQQIPDAGSIWNQINNQHNPFPQPPTTLDYCVFTEFKNNKCLFKCESGAILTEPAQKPDFSTGEPAGACATHIIRPIKPPFANKAVSTEQVYDSYGKYPSAAKASEVMTWAVNGFKFAKTAVTNQTIVVNGLGDYRFRIAYKAAAPLAIESSPVFKAELDAFERMFDMADRLENDGATVVTHEVASYEGGYYYVIGYFEGKKAAGIGNKAAGLEITLAAPLLRAKMQSNTLKTISLSLKGLEQMGSPDKAPAEYTRGVEEAAEAIEESLLNMDEAIRDRDSAMLRMETIRLEPTIEKLAKLAKSIEGEANYSYWAGKDIKRISAELGRSINEIRINAPFAF